MQLTRVAARNFRLFGGLEFKPRAGLNLITGANASGKTTLLEAIYLLGRAQSFRSAPALLAGAEGAHWQVRGDLSVGSGAPETSNEVSWSAEGVEIRIQGAAGTAADLVRRFAAQILEPDSHRLLQDGPVYRRRYLDWGVFHVEHRFFPAWRRYQRALKQRNQALRAGAPDSEVSAWNPELVESGEEVSALRVAHLSALKAPLSEALARLLPGLEWSLAFKSGWTAGQDLGDALAGQLAQDRRQASTTAGPHRAELQLKLAGRSSKHQVSRGQQKILIAGLLLAQAELIRQHTQRAPALLIDDFPAELGPAFQETLLASLLDYPGQVFVTAIEPTGALSAVSGNTPKNAVFHVEHGAVSAASLV